MPGGLQPYRIVAGMEIGCGARMSWPRIEGRNWIKSIAAEPTQERSVSEDDPIRVFVTHTFEETDDYLRVFEFLESVDLFYYLNVSRPDNVPMGGAPEAIKQELMRQVKESEAVIVLPIVYEQHEELTRFQMDVADENNKPMITIRPYGGIIDTPQEIVDRVKEHIEWKSRDMVDALKRQARNEDTARWEVIDFPGLEDGENT
jgi:hypothetical protein